MNDNKMVMHNAMIRGDTKMMGMMLDSGAATMNDWVGIGNIQTWIEDACWCGSPAAIEPAFPF